MTTSNKNDQIELNTNYLESEETHNYILYVNDIPEAIFNSTIDTIKASGKPDNILEKILEGKMKKFYSESTLMNQTYILDTEININKLINNFSVNNKFEIKDYKLVILGS